VSDGITEWHKMRREQELKAMTEEERAKAQSPRPRPHCDPRAEPVPEMVQPFTGEDGVVYGGRPFWEWARDSILDVTHGLKRKMLQVGLCCLASFWLGYWFGAS